MDSELGIRSKRIVDQVYSLLQDDRGDLEQSLQRVFLSLYGRTVRDGVVADRDFRYDDGHGRCCEKRAMIVRSKRANHNLCEGQIGKTVEL